MIAQDYQQKFKVFVQNYEYESVKAQILVAMRYINQVMLP